MSVMIELGELLKEARERKGMTLEEVSRRIKVSARTLAALESGDKDELPHVVYAKGFVKSYALELKLDPEKLGGMVDDAFAGDIEEAEAEVNLPPVTVKQKRSPMLFIVTGVLLAMMVAGGAAWFVLHSYGDRVAGMIPESSEKAPENISDIKKQESGPAPVVSKSADNKPLESSEAEVGAEKPSTNTAVPEKASELAGSQKTISKTVEATQAKKTAVTTSSTVSTALVTPPESADAKIVDAEKTVETVAMVKPKAVKAAKVAPVQKKKVVSPPAATSGTVGSVSTQVVQLLAKGDCWIEAWGEDFEKKDLYLRNGQKFFFRFPKDLNVKLGNSGVIDVALNGRPYTFDSGEGKVRTLVFAAKQ